MLMCYYSRVLPIAFIPCPSLSPIHIEYKYYLPSWSLQRDYFFPAHTDSLEILTLQDSRGSVSIAVRRLASHSESVCFLSKTPLDKKRERFWGEKAAVTKHYKNLQVPIKTNHLALLLKTGGTEGGRSNIWKPLVVKGKHFT